MTFPLFRLISGDTCITDFVIASNVTNWTLADEIQCTPVTALVINITVDPGVVCSGTMDLSGLPAGSTINLINNGAIIGFGGNGGNAVEMWSNEIDACGVFKAATVGAAGGAAISLGGDTTTINITNVSGNIWGGGGGGGGGGSAADFTGEISGGGGGGGGAGAAAAAGGQGSAGAGLPGSDGSAGSASASYPADPGGGAGGAAGATGGGGTLGGAGGNGSDYGVAGLNGVAGSGGDCIGAPSNGGSGGFAVAGSLATINFISGGGSPNVKGGVG